MLFIIVTQIILGLLTKRLFYLHIYVQFVNIVI